MRRGGRGPNSGGGRGRGRGGRGGRGRGGRGGHGGRGGGGGESGGGDRPRPPPGLRGREIGLWYAQFSRGNTKKREERDVGDRAVINIRQEQEQELAAALDNQHTQYNRGGYGYRGEASRQGNRVDHFADDSYDDQGMQQQGAGNCHQEAANGQHVKMEVNDDVVKIDDNPQIQIGNGQQIVMEPAREMKYTECQQITESTFSMGGKTGLVKNPEVDKRLREEMQSREDAVTTDSSYGRIIRFRLQLPSYNMRWEILKMVRDNQVSLISGETGCGKTTQVGQFILDDYIERNCGSQCHIICTQPRRISAISVAQRVAKERNEGVGQSCGYQIRLEEKKPRAQGSILFCTLGVLLRFMIDDPNIQRASHIIVDEIHERDTLSDFLLIILKDVLPRRPDLKIILMSATLNAEIFSQYFSNCPRLDIPGTAYEVKDHYLEDYIGKLNYMPQPPRPKKFRHRDINGAAKRQEQEEYNHYIASIERHHDRRVVQALQNLQYDIIDIDLIVSLIMMICETSSDGAILVFLPGWQDISNLNKALLECGMFSNRNRFIIIPLHSRMPTVNQREVFERPPDGCRKIVIATNIAETSITIDDVVFVIDGGKDKEKNYDFELNISSLDTGWICKASEKQRRGRAGRVQNGHCFHLFTKFHHSTFREFQLPEMLRTTLHELCLQIKVLNLGGIEQFLSKAIQPPSSDVIQRAIIELKQMRALTDDEKLTSLGRYLAILPVTPKIGRMIIFGAIFSCLDPVLTVASSLDSKDPFLAPLGKEREADECKRRFAGGSRSDHIALMRAFQEWDRCDGRDKDDFCWQNFLSNSHLRFIDGTKKQFASLLKGIGFLEYGNPHETQHNLNSDNDKLVKAVICAGLYPNVAKLQYNHKGTRIHSITCVEDMVTKKTMRVELHPKSVNANENDYDSQWLIYHEKMRINKIYLFDATEISPYSLLFFGGNIRYHQEGGVETIEVDKGIKFHCSHQTARLVMDVREKVDVLLGEKLADPYTNLVGNDVIKGIIKLIKGEMTRAKRDIL